jgi:hypothetical protein
LGAESVDLSATSLAFAAGSLGALSGQMRLTSHMAGRSEITARTSFLQERLAHESSRLDLHFEIKRGPR